MLHEACRMQLGQAAPVEGILEHMSRDSGIVVPKRTCFHLHGTASSQVAVARVSAVEHLDSLGHTLGEEDVAGDLERVVENLLEASGGPISRALGTDTFDESALDPIAESPCFNVDVGNDLAFKEVLSRARSVRHPQQTDATLVSKTLVRVEPVAVLQRNECRGFDVQVRHPPAHFEYVPETPVA